MILEASNICKKYRCIQALDGVTFGINEGESVGLLGPNGAGKSTTIEILLGIVKPDSGTIKFEGIELNWGNLKKYQALMGYVPQEYAFFPELNAKENVVFWGKVYGLRGKELKSALDKAFEFAGLTDMRTPAGQFSGGMKRRLNIACGIVHSPEVLFMDEPTVGVDPQSRNKILASIAMLNECGTTIVFSSHYMEEVEQICERCVIIDHGKVLMANTIENLLLTVQDKRVLQVVVDYPLIARKAIEKIDGLSVINVEEASLSFSLQGDTDLVNALDLIADSGCTIQSVSSKAVNLEDVFFTFTGSSLRD